MTIYAGTGEPTWWPGYKGIGVLKSIDSGNTWNVTGAIGNDRFSAIVVDPTTITSNPATTTLYAGGTPGGLYKSTDGGGTWTQILNKSISGLALDPTNSAIIYAAVSYEGIYKYDPIGGTWSLFNTGLGSFPQLILIAIGQATPHTMYAKLDETVYKYDSGTSSWISLGNHGSTTYGYWNNVLEVDPQNSNVVFAGGIGFERTYDGGTTWQIISGLHSDQHALVFSSSNHLVVFAGDDGGVYRGTYSSLMDTGTWVKMSDGLILTAFNQIGSSPIGNNVIGGGAQDNGTNRTAGGLTYNNIYGADGGFFVIDPASPYNLYAESQYGGIGKSTNGGASFGGATSGFAGGPWVTPIILDPNSPLEPNRILFAGGTNNVYRSISSASSWSVSSPSTGGSVIALALAPSSSAIVYAGTDSGKVWRSSDGGATTGNWKDITAGTIMGSVTLPNRMVTDIAVDLANPDNVFVAFSGFASSTPTTPGHVYKATSADGFMTWTWEDVTSNLPDVPVNAIVVDPSSANTLYIGTDIGVFYTTNGGSSWSDFGNGLPNVVIADLIITNGKLKAATYGYGMWQIDLGGVCSNVDVYVRDNILDTGETTPSPSYVIDPTTVGGYVYWWESADIKVDGYPYDPTISADPLFDGVEFDGFTNEDVIRNDVGHPNPNHLYIQVHNRGPLSAHNVKVKALYADASLGLPALPADFWSSYPNDWSAASGWNTVDAGVPFQTITELLPHTPQVLSWNWVVPATQNAHTCMLAVISADEDPVTRTDGTPGDHDLGTIVPNDKHITLHNLHVITGSSPKGGIPMGAYFNIHNILPDPIPYTIDFDLAGLPKTTKLSMLMPKLAGETLKGKGIDVKSIRDTKDWWHKPLVHAKIDWHHEIRIDTDFVDDCNNRVVSLPNILVPAEDKIQAGIAIELPHNVKPGSNYRFSLIQRHGKVVVGGSTFILKIPFAEVKVE